MCVHDAEDDSKLCVFSFLKMSNINSNFSGPQISYLSVVVGWSVIGAFDRL